MAADMELAFNPRRDGLPLDHVLYSAFLFYIFVESWSSQGFGLHCFATGGMWGGRCVLGRGGGRLHRHLHWPGAPPDPAEGPRGLRDAAPRLGARSPSPKKIHPSPARGKQIRGGGGRVLPTFPPSFPQVPLTGASPPTAPTVPHPRTQPHHRRPPSPLGRVGLPHLPSSVDLFNFRRPFENTGCCSNSLAPKDGPSDSPLAAITRAFEQRFGVRLQLFVPPECP